MQFVNIVFCQGDDSIEPLNIYNELGIDNAIEYLAQWDYGENDNVQNTLGSGTTDRIIERGDYILTLNLKYGYIGLTRKV